MKFIVRSSGMIINTCGWTIGKGYELLLHAIQVTNTNVVFVIDNERLYNDLGQELRSKHVELVKLPKSGGVRIFTSQKRILLLILEL
jgi:polynucleotide 5'-kinase involved in rRNA processing